jgi:hypothetical protein
LTIIQIRVKRSHVFSKGKSVARFNLFGSLGKSFYDAVHGLRGNSVSINGKRIYVDGKLITDEAEGVIRLEITEGVLQNVEASCDVTCGEVRGNVDAGMAVNCGNVGGDVESGMNVTCGDIGRDAEAGMSITAKDIHGDADAGMSIKANNVMGKSRSAF